MARRSGSPWRGRNNLERQPHDGELVADGFWWPEAARSRNKQAQCLTKKYAYDRCTASLSVSLLLVLFYFVWFFFLCKKIGLVRLSRATLALAGRAHARGTPIKLRVSLEVIRKF
jgi:hypothetical protein